MDNTIKKLKEWVKANYSTSKCNWSAERSCGNYDDCFEDGMDSGTSWAAHEVGAILGMELEEPEED